MPEFYVEPMTDRRTCFKCNKTRKKKLFKCAGCEAITYCSLGCQREDSTRHKWNCVPVMVTEIPGKGRGIVAARDIKMGELIFEDEPVIKLATTVNGRFVDPGFMTSLRDQIENLPSEARSQYYKLSSSGHANVFNVSRSDFEVLKLFTNNSKMCNPSPGKEEYSDLAVLYLNGALVNHSCVPNAALGGLSDLGVELRAVKDISKGVEITICYYDGDVKNYGSILRKRKTAIKKHFWFDCKCPVCLGQVSCQEKILKKRIELLNKLDPALNILTNWKREAGIRNKILDLTMVLLIGGIKEKIVASVALAGSAHLARDKDLVKKAMDKLRQVVDETKLAYVQGLSEILERRFSQFSTEFSSGTPPVEREIELIMAESDIEIDVMTPLSEVD